MGKIAFFLVSKVHFDTAVWITFVDDLFLLFLQSPTRLQNLAICLSCFLFNIFFLRTGERFGVTVYEPEKEAFVFIQE